MPNIKLLSYFPLTIFIALIFLLEAVHLEKTMGMIISIFISLISFQIMAAAVKEKYGSYPELKQIQLRTGLLSVIFLLAIVTGFLHLNKILSVTWRWVLFFTLLLLYFIVLFNSVNLLYTIKSRLHSQDRTGE